MFRDHKDGYGADCKVCGKPFSLLSQCNCEVPVVYTSNFETAAEALERAEKQRTAKADKQAAKDKAYDRIMEEESARQYEESKGKDECPGRSQVKCKKCGKCHSVFKDCDGIGDFPLTTPSDKPSLSDAGIGTPDDYDWFGYYDEHEVDTVCNIDVGKNEGIRELYDELGKLSWDSDDEGWNEAIAAVRLAIKDIIQGGADSL